MANVCAVCSKGTEVRARVDAAIVEGHSFREISKQFESEGISYSSVWRHAQAHLSSDLLDAVAQAQGLKAGDFAQRLQQIADRAREASDKALADGHPRDVARAVDSEIRALMVMMTRLGINDTDTVESLREGDNLARAVVQIMKFQPELGLAPVLIEALRERREYDLASAIEDITTKKEIEQ